MAEIATIQEKHTAGAQAIGFDYQFYYFMCLALELKHGQKVGFEVKDDVHIDNIDGTTILFQTKHTISGKDSKSSQNLTTLDADLWKTLNNWVEMIKTDESILSTHLFYLVTNKGEGNNKFIEAFFLFNTDKDIDKIFEILKKLRDETQNNKIKPLIKNVLSLGKEKTKSFFSKLIIKTNIDDIIDKVKIKILECTKNADLVDAVFESLSSNMNMAKYIDIKDRKKIEITFDDFNNKFGKCFKVAFENKPLPKREFPILLPDDLEEQLFVKQLLDIGEIRSGSKKITEYTTQMLKALNHFSFWVDENFVLPSDMDEFKKNSILLWVNEFRVKYRQIERQIDSGTLLEELENKIRNLGIELIDYLRRQDLSIPNYPSLGIEFSNGYYYVLSDKLEIGWHFDWENKYKKK